MTERIPNPGSREAAADGCTCAVMDNSYGRGYRTTDVHWQDGGVYVVTEGCPLHWEQTLAWADAAKARRERGVR